MKKTKMFTEEVVETSLEEKEMNPRDQRFDPLRA